MKPLVCRVNSKKPRVSARLTFEEVIAIIEGRCRHYRRAYTMAKGQASPKMFEVRGSIEALVELQELLHIVERYPKYRRRLLKLVLRGGRKSLSL